MNPLPAFLIFPYFYASCILYVILLGLRTVPSDGYGCTIDGEVMGVVHPSTLPSSQVSKALTGTEGYGDGRCTVDGVIQWTAVCWF